jgi:hypothetical protein
MKAHDAWPFAVPATVLDARCNPRTLPRGYVLNAHEAEALFHLGYVAGASYVVDDKGMVRRVVSTFEGLSWSFSGMPCANGHIAPRRSRTDPRRSVCMGCRAASQARARDR